MDARTRYAHDAVRPGRPSGAGEEGVSSPEFGAIFAAAPGINLVLAADAPRFTMLAASDERLAATLTTREGTLGRPLFEVFSDGNPENDEPSGVTNLRASLDTVLRTREPHHMAVQRYDLRRPDGTWEVRHWAPRNVPYSMPTVRCASSCTTSKTSRTKCSAGRRISDCAASTPRARARATRSKRRTRVSASNSSS